MMAFAGQYRTARFGAAGEGNYASTIVSDTRDEDADHGLTLSPKIQSNEWEQNGAGVFDEDALDALLGDPADFNFGQQHPRDDSWLHDAFNQIEPPAKRRKLTPPPWHDDSPASQPAIPSSIPFVTSNSDNAIPDNDNNVHNPPIDDLEADLAAELEKEFNSAPINDLEAELEAEFDKEVSSVAATTRCSGPEIIDLEDETLFPSDPNSPDANSPNKKKDTFEIVKPTKYWNPYGISQPSHPRKRSKVISGPIILSEQGISIPRPSPEHLRRPSTSKAVPTNPSHQTNSSSKPPLQRSTNSTSPPKETPTFATHNSSQDDHSIFDEDDGSLFGDGETLEPCNSFGSTTSSTQPCQPETQSFRANISPTERFPMPRRPEAHSVGLPVPEAPRSTPPTAGQHTTRAPMPQAPAAYHASIPVTRQTTVPYPKYQGDVVQSQFVSPHQNPQWHPQGFRGPYQAPSSLRGNPQWSTPQPPPPGIWQWVPFPQHEAPRLQPLQPKPPRTTISRPTTTTATTSSPSPRNSESGSSTEYAFSRPSSPMNEQLYRSTRYKSVYITPPSSASFDPDVPVTSVEKEPRLEGAALGAFVHKTCRIPYMSKVAATQYAMNRAHDVALSVTGPPAASQTNGRRASASSTLQQTSKELPFEEIIPRLKAKLAESSQTPHTVPQSLVALFESLEKKFDQDINFQKSVLTWAIAKLEVMSMSKHTTLESAGLREVQGIPRSETQTIQNTTIQCESEAVSLSLEPQLPENVSYRTMLKQTQIQVHDLLVERDALRTKTANMREYVAYLEAITRSLRPNDQRAGNGGHNKGTRRPRVSGGHQPVMDEHQPIVASEK